MGKVKEISVNYSRTVNLGNFESVKIEAGEVLVLDRNDDASEALMDTAFADVKDFVSAHVRAIKKKQEAGK